MTTGTATVTPISEAKNPNMEKSVKRLKELEKSIDNLKEQVTKLEWDIGKNLSNIKDKALWQVAGHHKSFGEYVQTRFGFTRQTAWSYIEIATKLSREDAEELPITYQRQVVKIPDPEERQKLIEEVKKEKPTTRELAKTVDAKRKEIGLKTERVGFEGTVMLNQRLKPGVVAEGTWEESGEAWVARLELGGQVFEFKDYGQDVDPNWTLTLLEDE